MRYSYFLIGIILGLLSPIALLAQQATVTGQGMASETPWDGTLECEETLLPIAIKARSIDV